MNRIADPIILDPPTTRDSSPRDLPDSHHNNPAEGSDVPKLPGRAYDSRRGPCSDQRRRRRSNHHGALGTGGMFESPNQGVGIHSTGATTTDSSGRGITATIGAYAAGLGTDPTDSAGGDLEQRL